jgi:putative membrane protein
LGLALFLFWRAGVGPLLQLLQTSGVWLVLASLVHVVPMFINAQAWRELMPADAYSLRRLALATWIRESVNGLLPVARVGGEFAAYRSLARASADPALAASLVVDVVVTLFSQGIFGLVGVILLLGRETAQPRIAQIAGAAFAMAGVGAALVFLQRSGLIARCIEAANRWLADRWRLAIEQSAQVDHLVRRLYRRGAALRKCLALQLLGYLTGATELWLVLFSLGHPSPIDAIVLEAAVQVVASAGFFVPGALGIQEGGFLLVGAMLGLDAPTALALAAARRLRELLVFFPGLLAWHSLESRRSPLAG